MEKRRKTAGETAKTEPLWGVVALVGLVVSTTCFGSILVTGASLALFAIGAWKGGYMKGGAE